MAFEKRYGKENKSKCDKVQTWHYTYSWHTLIQLIEVTFTQKHVLVKRAHTQALSAPFLCLLVQLIPVFLMSVPVSSGSMNRKIALNKFIVIHCLKIKYENGPRYLPQAPIRLPPQVQCTPSNVQDLMWERRNYIGSCAETVRGKLSFIVGPESDCVDL